MQLARELKIKIKIKNSNKPKVINLPAVEIIELQNRSVRD
jgi:hypothetical protein